MKLSEENLKTLLTSLHEIIEAHANHTAEKMHKGEVEELMHYPPNHGLTENELNSLSKLTNNIVLKSALRKILANNSAGVLFDMLNLIDGTSEPNPNIGGWTEVSIVDKTDALGTDLIMLHDEFYSTYWDWREIRPKADWKLDTYDGK